MWARADPSPGSETGGSGGPCAAAGGGGGRNSEELLLRQRRRLAVARTPCWWSSRASVSPLVGEDEEAHPAHLGGRGPQHPGPLTMSLKAPRTAAVRMPRSTPSTLSAAEAQSSRWR